MTNTQTITLSQAEFAAYQRAVDRARDEIARLSAELAELHRAHDQRQHALDAERRARALAEADYAHLHAALIAWESSDGTDRFIQVDDRLAGLARSLRETTDHPGRALLTELDAARAVVAAMRAIDRHVIGACEDVSVSQGGMPVPCDECGEMREIAAQALAAYDAAAKVSQE